MRRKVRLVAEREKYNPTIEMLEKLATALKLGGGPVQSR
jgi:hypothetical protein